MLDWTDGYGKSGGIKWIVFLQWICMDFHIGKWMILSYFLKKNSSYGFPMDLLNEQRKIRRDNRYTSDLNNGEKSDKIYGLSYWCVSRKEWIWEWGWDDYILMVI